MDTDLIEGRGCTQGRTEKDSSFECMRIVAMIAVVCGHWYGQCGLDVYSGDNVLVEIFCFNHRIANLAFLFISCYFLQYKKWKFERFMSLWLKTFMETLALSTLCLFVFHSGGGTGLDPEFFPDIRSSGVVYIGLFDLLVDSSISGRGLEWCFGKNREVDYAGPRYADCSAANISAAIL